MIARKLPGPGSQLRPVNMQFSDHTLLTQKITEAYNGPEHVPGPGLISMLSGSGRFMLNGEAHRVGQGHYLVIAEHSLLSVRLTQPGAQPLMMFFQSDLVSETLRRQGAELCWLERVHPMDPLLMERLAWLHRFGNNCGSFSALKADAMIGDILAMLIRDAKAARLTAERLSVSRKVTRIQLFRRLSQTRDWMDANYATAQSLETLARQATLNRQHFLRTFRDCFGLTPHQYLTTIRLAAAATLLTDTGQSVTAICRLTGFESLPSFSSLFRDRYGASPTAYRYAKRSIHSAIQSSGSEDQDRLPAPISS